MSFVGLFNSFRCSRLYLCLFSCVAAGRGNAARSLRSFRRGVGAQRRGAIHCCRGRSTWDGLRRTSAGERRGVGSMHAFVFVQVLSLLMLLLKEFRCPVAAIITVVGWWEADCWDVRAPHRPYSLFAVVRTLQSEQHCMYKALLETCVGHRLQHGRRAPGLRCGCAAQASADCGGSARCWLRCRGKAGSSVPQPHLCRAGGTPQHGLSQTCIPPACWSYAKFRGLHTINGALPMLPSQSS